MASRPLVSTVPSGPSTASIPTYPRYVMSTLSSMAPFCFSIIPVHRRNSLKSCEHWPGDVSGSIWFSPSREVSIPNTQLQWSHTEQCWKLAQLMIRISPHCVNGSVFLKRIHEILIFQIDSKACQNWRQWRRTGFWQWNIQFIARTSRYF